MRLPNAERAFVDLAKLRDYSLSASHPEGKHKARVFAAALGIFSSDAEWLRDQLLAAVLHEACTVGRKTEFGDRYTVDATVRHRDRERVFAAHGSSVRTRNSLVSFPAMCYERPSANDSREASRCCGAPA